MGGFGYLGGNAQAPATRSNPNTSGMTVDAEAAGQLGVTVTEVAEAIDRQERELQAKRDAEADALARAKASNALLDHELRAKTLQASIASRIETGDLDYREADREFEELSADLGDPVLDGLAPDDAERVAGGYRRNVAAARMGLSVAVEGARRQEGKTQVVAAFDKLDKIAGLPGASIDQLASRAASLGQLWTAAGLDPAQFEKTRQGYVDKWWTGHATRRALQGRENPAELQALERDLIADDGFYADKLDVDKRNALFSQVLGAQSRLEAKEQHAADKRLAVATRALSAIDQQIASGIPATPEMWAGWADQVKGTDLEAEFQDRVQGEIAVQKVLRLPPDQQETHVQQAEAALLSGGGTPRDKANLDRLKRAVEANQESMRETPLLYHQQRTGEVVPVLDMQALTSGDVAAIHGQIRGRMETLATMRQELGPEVGNAPLLPQEAKALSTALRQVTLAQQVQMFGTLSKAIGDPEAYRGAMQQIAPDSPVTALAGTLFPGNEKGATLLLKGEQLLNRAPGDRSTDGKGSAFPMPPPKEFDEAVAQAVGNAFRGRPEAYAIAMQAVRAGYAGAAATDGDVTGEIDLDRIENVIRFTIGETVTINGTDVLAPIGMDEDVFEDALEEAWESAAGNRPEGASDDFGVYGLRQAGDGRYMVTFGRSYLHGRDGRPMLLQVRP